MVIHLHLKLVLDIKLLNNNSKLKLKKDNDEFIFFSCKKHMNETENLCYTNYSMFIADLGLMLDNLME